MLSKKEYIKLLSESKLTKSKFDTLLESKGEQFDNLDELDSYGYAVINGFRGTRREFDLTDGEKLYGVEKKIDIISNKLYAQVDELDNKTDKLFSDTKDLNDNIKDDINKLYDKFANTITVVNAFDQKVTEVQDDHQKIMDSIKSIPVKEYAQMPGELARIKSQMDTQDTFHTDRLNGTIGTLKMKSDKGHKHQIEDIIGLKNIISGINNEVLRLANKNPPEINMYSKEEIYTKNEVNSRLRDLLYQGGRPSVNDSGLSLQQSWSSQYTYNKILSLISSPVYSIKTITSSYNITSTDYTIIGNATSGVVNVTLPSATLYKGKVFNIKKIDATTNSVVIKTTSSQLIDGATTKSISTKNLTINVQSDGSTWHIL